jgi:hypothetical protein
LGKSTVFVAHGYAGKIEESVKLGTEVSVIRIIQEVGLCSEYELCRMHGLRMKMNATLFISILLSVTQ